MYCGLLDYTVQSCKFLPTFRCLDYILKMEATGYSETLITIYNVTRIHNPEVHNTNLHRCENLKSHTRIILTA
jgi:hypothetical protein